MTPQVVTMDDFHLQIDHDQVFHLLDCYPESPVYEEMNQLFEELLPEVLKLASPKGALCFSEVREEYAPNLLPVGSKAVYMIVTIGRKISELSSRCFKEGDYPRGLLADAMADGCIFSMEQDALPVLKKECRKRHLGIFHRYEAPVDVPMRVQKIAFEEMHADTLLGLSITSGYMLDPVKSNCQVFGVTEDENEFQIEHDCRKCPRTDCPMRNIPPVQVTVQLPEGQKIIRCRDGQSLLDALKAENAAPAALCGGNGRCGKCRIRVTEGKLPVTEEDRKQIPEEERQEGWRLSCTAYPKENLTVFCTPHEESDFKVQTDFHAEILTDAASPCDGFGIAVDIGTTTLAVSLVSLKEKKMTDTCTGINPQRSFGADVIARIQAANEGHLAELQTLIRTALREEIRSLCSRNRVTKDSIREIVIAGNTTMGHLLLGFSCAGLGVVPFKPVDISRMKKSCREVFQDDFLGDVPVILIPGISTYVGGDITAGFYACDFLHHKKNCALIDLGTNGEMGIGNQEKILVTSTAAGPAFEGGNISWGVGSVPGAICGLKIRKILQEGREEITAETETIEHAPPIGICGTGVIETAAELVKSGLLDETGILEDPYFDGGFPLAETKDRKVISFSEKDVREIQLAKSAVRAGFETLLLRAGLVCDDLETVYLAGGFGYQIDREKAIAIGMLPEALKDKITAVGNSSLGGAVKYLLSENAGEETDRIVNLAEEVSLADDAKFNDFYMDYMLFGNEEEDE